MAAPPATRGISWTLSDAFTRGELDLSARPGAPRPDWEGLPEFGAAGRLRGAGASDVEVRLFCTFTAAVDRARDSDDLWACAAALWLEQRWVYQPERVVVRPIDELREVLRSFGVSRRHGPDGQAWSRIASVLSDRDQAPAVHQALHEGTGSSDTLMRELVATGRDGNTLFPLLRSKDRPDVDTHARCARQRIHWRHRDSPDRCRYSGQTGELHARRDRQPGRAPQGDPGAVGARGRDGRQRRPGWTPEHSRGTRPSALVRGEMGL